MARRSLSLKRSEFSEAAAANQFLAISPQLMTGSINQCDNYSSVT